MTERVNIVKPGTKRRNITSQKIVHGKSHSIRREVRLQLTCI